MARPASRLITAAGVLLAATAACALVPSVTATAAPARSTTATRVDLAALARTTPHALRERSTSPTASGNPIGLVDSTTATSGGVNVVGWAGDPDANGANISVEALMDGTTVLSTVTTSIARPGISKGNDLGPTPGFALSVPLPTTGTHTVCIVALNVGAGLDNVMRCFATPLGTRLSSSQVTAHSPVGAVTGGSATNTTMSVSGWTSDPDELNRSVVAVLYVDGEPAQTVITRYHPWPRPQQSGRRSAFSFRVPVDSGSHLGCVWAVNIGLGSNSFLGCRAIGTSSHQAMAAPAPASIGAKVVTEAKKHIGQRYVWGAEGPKTFDCSGLVMYSYGKNGFTTPRVAADQFAAAKVIPASDARPGDLVFYHDSEGNVYHVGIYLSPGQTVAAIDTQEGVNYQPIWDPTWATYGTFDHS